MINKVSHTTFCLRFQVSYCYTCSYQLTDLPHTKLFASILPLVSVLLKQRAYYQAVTILNNAHIATHTGCDVLQHCPVMIGSKETPKVETTHVDVHITHLKSWDKNDCWMATVVGKGGLSVPVMMEYLGKISKASYSHWCPPAVRNKLYNMQHTKCSSSALS